MKRNETPSGGDIKTWLDRIRKDRDWLATQLNSSKLTVDSWFSKRGFPRTKLAAIVEMMNKDDEEKTSQIRVPLSDEALELAHKAAHIVSAEFQDFCSRAIKHRAEELIKQQGNKVTAFPDHIPDATKKVFEMPFLGAVAAGEPVSAPRDEVISVARDYGSGHFVVEINGQSAEPEFMDGDRWIIRAVDSGTPAQGKPCIVSDGSGSYLKKWNRKKKVFESINSDFNDVMPAEEAKLQGYPVERLP